MTIRGGGHPKQAMVLKPVSRMGPPPRSFAADGKLPSDHRPDHNQRGRRARVCQAATDSRGLETTERAARAERRPDLDRPCARRPQHVWVGAKKRDSESNKETGMKEVESGVKYMLDFKSPIQGLLSVHSRCGLHTRAVTNS